MAGIEVFGFTELYIPAAFLVAGVLVMYRLQWQAFFYLLVVIYACDSFIQFGFLSAILGFQIILGRMYNSAADG